jgi:hypothetical protein
MLSLGSHQTDRILQRDEASFVEAIRAEIRRQHPAWRSTDAMLSEQVRVGLARARRHGLTADRHLAEFVLVMCEVAPNFDQQPEIADHLADPSLPPGERWERLFTPQFDAAWQAADDPAFLDADAWYLQPPPPRGPQDLPDADDWAGWLASTRHGRAAGSWPRRPSTPPGWSILPRCPTASAW